MKLNKPLLIYLFLFSLVACIPKHSTFFFAVLSLANLILLSKNKYKGYVLLSTTLIGNELFAVINVALFIIMTVTKDFFHINLGRGKQKRHVLIPIFFIVAVSLTSAMLYSTFWNIIFYLLYLILLVVTYVHCKIDINKQELQKLIRGFVLIEFTATVLIVIRTNNLTPGDTFGGTLLNAHFFANWLLVSLFGLLNVPTEYSLLKRIKRNYVYIILILWMIYLASAITIFIAACIACVLFIILYPINKSKGPDLLLLIVISYIGIFLILGVLYLEPVKTFLFSKSNYLNLYIYSSGWNYKLTYFYGTLFETLKGIRLFVGYGLGQYGSRFANLFAYDVMWRADNGINNLVASLFESHYLPQYAQYVSFYDAKFVDNVMWRSAIMSYPFSSFIALIAETGIIGVVLLARLIDKTFRLSRGKIIIYYFFIACIFDVFFDDYICILVVIVYLAFLESVKSK